MKRAREIWFFRDSPVVSLARPLGRRYALRAAGSPGRNGRGGRAIAEVPEGAAVWLADAARDPVAKLRRLARESPHLRLIAVTGPRSSRCPAGREWFACVPRNARPALERAIAAAFENLELAEKARAAQAELGRAEQEREELDRIGVALSSTHDVEALLEVILAKAREITGADAGSLYLVENPRPPNGSSSGERRLRFQLTQNDSRQFPFAEFTLPMTEESLAGYAAVRGETVVLDDVYRVPPDRPYRFNPSYDEETGYRTRSVLAVPMKNARGEVLGVLQLLNRKRDRAARLLAPEDFEREVEPFPPHAVRLVESLASQAAVAYENSRLYRDIESLFEGFVQAAVTAIEQRDPTTSGHSLRVSKMTMGLAEIVDRADRGLYASVRFTRDQMKEIRYAALLHDFGKVGVREEVLVKAKKLYPAQMEVIRNRFDFVRRDIEAHYATRKYRAAMELARDDAARAVALLEEECRRRIAELEEAYEAVCAANEPTVLESGTFERLFEIAQQTYRDPRGGELPLLSQEEVRFLSIPRGSLDPEERQQIESHVVHSFNFLMQIPWTPEIRNIPEIARAHHEKLNGSGYPYRLKGEEIPIQARMMTICDIFDALSAADRPYKKAVPPDRALAILEDSVAKKELDAELFQMFIEGRIYELMTAPR